MNGEYQVRGYAKLVLRLSLASFLLVSLVIIIYLVFSENIQ